MIRSLAQRLPFFYGWVIVGCTMCSSVVRQTAAVATLSIFLVPMTEEFGWSRTGISGAVSLGGGSVRSSRRSSGRCSTATARGRCWSRARWR